MIPSDRISSGVEMAFWSCPVCGDRVDRELIREAEDGSFPQDYDYTMYESNTSFLLKIIEHVCVHLKEGM